MKDQMKKKPKGDDMELEAKKDVIRQMREVAMDEMGNGLKVKKVSVMAPDKENLAEGLEKAKQLLSQMPGHDTDSGDMMASDHMEDEMSEHDEASMTDEQIDEEIARLEELKRMKMRS